MVDGSYTYTNWGYTSATYKCDSLIAQLDKDEWGYKTTNVGVTVIGKSANVPTIQNWYMNDAQSDSTSYPLPGEAIGSYNIHTVLYTDMNKKGTQNSKFTSICISPCWVNMGDSRVYLSNANYGVYTYNHKYTDVQLYNLIAEGITNNIGSECFDVV